MATIYRVEKDGWGLYHTDVDFDRFADLADDDHPMIFNDKLIGKLFDNYGPKLDTPASMWSSLRFGFASKEQLLRWFSHKGWLQALDDAGIVVGIYEAPDVEIGDTQAVFDMSTATKVGIIKPTEVRP